MACETSRQHFPGCCQPTRKSSFATLELPRHFLALPAFQIAKHNGCSVFLGQGGQLPVNQRSQILSDLLLNNDCSFRHFPHLSSPCSAPGVGSPRFQRGPIGSPVQPVAHQLPLTERRCLAHEDQEGCLKCIFSILPVEKDPLAHAQDHRPVSSYQRLE